MNKRREGAPVFRARIVVLGLFLFTLFGTAAFFAIKLHLFPRKDLVTLAARQHNRTVKIPAERGEILDRNYQPLAKTVQGYNVCATSARAADDPLKFATVCNILGLDRPKTLELVTKRNKAATQLKTKITPAEADQIRAVDSDFITVDVQPTRYYPKGDLAGQIIGAVRDGDKPIGGIEYKYDDVLKGRDFAVRTKRIGDTRNLLESVPDLEKAKGSSVVLTIDEEIQHVAQSELDKTVEKYQAKGGNAIVMDVATGEILAMAQAPALNPNQYSKAPLEQRVIQAVTNVYEPGSTMKGIFLSVYLDEKGHSITDSVYCEGGKWRVYDYTIHDHGGHGTLTVPEVLEVSSNIGVGKLSQRISRAQFYEGLKRFGLGTPTGVDLSAESRGILHAPEKWSGMTSINMAFGQGVSVTPLQLLTAYAAIANGGVRMKPRIVREILDVEGKAVRTFEPEPAGTAISAKTAQTISSMLERVVYGDRGTGKLAKVPGYRVAGKTGTAWQTDPATGRYDKRRVVASFIGFAPSRNPKIAVLVTIDRPDTRLGEYGGTLAAPVFSSICRQALPTLGAKPDLEEKEEEKPAPKVAKKTMEDAPEEPPEYPAENLTSGAMPDLAGLPMREALRRLEQSGVPVALEIKGFGFLQRQTPPPGESLLPETVCVLEFIDAI
ncbi:hypothetical protein EPN96_07370 [bacterium]|nr:MAG: hypothetical protein EPN96_07370 [bacterium]